MQIIPYCGTPPVPGSVMWNLDPWLLVALAAVAGCYWAVARHDGTPASRRVAFYAGWGLLSLSLISPLCNLSVALFSARVGQHMLIEFIAAPLIACGLPRMLERASPGSGDRPGAGGLLASVTFAAVLWFWHLPTPYEWTFRSTEAYWLMHITLAGSAVMLWRVLLDGSRPVGSLIASGITTAQMTLLGAIYTFAGRAFFSVHWGTTTAWGFSPLEDQQLGGLIMWIPPGLLLTAVAIHALYVLLSEPSSDFVRVR